MLYIKTNNVEHGIPNKFPPDFFSKKVLKTNCVQNLDSTLGELVFPDMYIIPTYLCAQVYILGQ